MYKFNDDSIKVINTIDSRLGALVHCVLANSKYEFRIPSTGGLRTSEEQNELFNKGWSKLDGYNKKSYHQSGYAIDIALYDDHGLCYKCKHKYENIASSFKTYFDIFKNLGIFPENSKIIWGGDWKNFIDLPHFEIRGL